MGTNNELLQKIDDGYAKFSKGQKKLADYIRRDYDKAAFLTAAKMGHGHLKMVNFILNMA